MSGTRIAMIAAALLACGYVSAALWIGGTAAAQDGGAAQPAEAHKAIDPAALWGSQFDTRLSRAQAGYGRTFFVPDGKPVLQSVWVHAAAYGSGDPRDLVVAITDMDLHPLAVFGVPYSALPRGATPEWRELRVPEEVRPPKEFAVVLHPHSLQDCGVYASASRVREGQPSSWLVPPGEDKPYRLDIEGQPADWAIQCQMTDRFMPPADAPISLRYGDAQPEGVKSMGGAAQMVRFQTPDGSPCTVTRVLIAGGYYGRPGVDGQENEFIVRVYDSQMQPVGQWSFRYDEFYRSETAGWASLPLEGGPKVSGEFSVACDMQSRPTPGVYVGYDADAKESHSFVLSSTGATPWSLQGQTANWCIRCELRKAR